MKIDREDLVKCSNCEWCEKVSGGRRDCYWPFLHIEGALPNTVVNAEDFKWCDNFSPTLEWTVECMKEDLKALRELVSHMIEKYEGGPSDG